jgi:rhodanese-related sulfurtransferase
MKKIITVEDLSRMIDSDAALQLIDVRSPGEYASGHVPQALNIPLEQADARIDDLGKGKVAILCHSGSRAQMACDLLSQHHPDLLVVQGGTQAWIQAGKPIVKGVSGRWSLERQVRLVAGLMILAGTILAVTVQPSWIYLAMFVGAGLTFAGATNQCGMAMLLGKLPWNQPAKCALPNKEVKA